MVGWLAVWLAMYRRAIRVKSAFSLNRMKKKEFIQTTTRRNKRSCFGFFNVFVATQMQKGLFHLCILRWICRVHVIAFVVVCLFGSCKQSERRSETKKRFDSLVRCLRIELTVCAFPRFYLLASSHSQNASSPAQEQETHTACVHAYMREFSFLFLRHIKLSSHHRGNKHTHTHLHTHRIQRHL